MVDLFRNLNWEVKSFWDWISEAVMKVTSTFKEQIGYWLRIHRDEQFLMIDLPSGRTLYYYLPEVGVNSRGFAGLTYMGIDQYTYQWKRIHTHPGKLTENIVQALAREVLAHAMLRFEHLYGEICPIIGHVHDEVITLTTNEEAEPHLALLNLNLKETPPWAPRLLLDAEGYIAERYTKT